MGLKDLFKPKIEATYITSDGERIHLDEDGVLKQDEERLSNCIPLGYGLVCYKTTRVEKDEEWGAKKGDLVISSGWLPSKTETGLQVGSEQSEYAKNHPACNLIITKKYALQLIQDLITYVNEN